MLKDFREEKTRKRYQPAESFSSCQGHNATLGLSSSHMPDQIAKKDGC